MAGALIRQGDCVARHIGRRTSRLIAAALLSLLAFVSAQGASAAPRPDRAAGVHAYLLRGFINIFSLGLDELAPKLRAHGIRADVYNHLFAESIVAEMKNEYRSGRTKSFILIGHSMGAVAVIDMVRELADSGVPIALAVTLDAADTVLTAGRVNNFVNLYIRNGAIGGVVRAGPNFHGRIANVDLSSHPSVTHVTITQDPAVQNLLLRYAVGSLGRGAVSPSVAARPKPSAAQSHPRRNQAHAFRPQPAVEPR